MRSVAVFHCRTQRLSRMSRGNPAKKQSLSILVHDCSFFFARSRCSLAKGAKSFDCSSFFTVFFSLSLLFAARSNAPVCVCVTFCLTRRKHVLFSILYPKLSIPYYIKERTPVDIVFLCPVTGIHYIYTQRHTHTQLSFVSSKLLLLLFLFFTFSLEVKQH